MRNTDIRNKIVTSGLKYWEVAAALGIQDGTFSRRLRHELSAEEQEKVFTIIEQLKMEREGC